MGQKSRRKKERRENSLLQVARSERRGRSVGTSQAEYEAAVCRDGARALREALLARANDRWYSAERYGMPLLPRLRGLLKKAAVCRSLALALEADFSADNAPLPKVWLDQLAWFTDQVLAATRLFLLGQPIGAVALARFSFDRWTMNLASSTGTPRKDAEKTGPFYKRVWSFYPGTADDADKLWEMMSDLLHGRGELQPLLEWSGDLGEFRNSRHLQEAAHYLFRSLELSMLQLKACLVDAAVQVGRQDVAEAAHTDLNTSSSPFSFRPLTPMLYPVTPFHLSEQYLEPHAQVMHLWQSNHLQVFEADADLLDTLAWGCFVDYRQRAADIQRLQYDKEAELKGDSYYPESVHEQFQIVVLIAEMAEVAANWTPNETESKGLRLAASSLRSAFYLWLEDDDRAMMALRSAIQGLAYVRVGRDKPASAAKLISGSSPPDRWVEKAGWGRLESMMRCLSELSHVGKNSRWSGAHALLSKLQAPDYDGYGIQTARKHALNVIEALTATEVITSLASVSPDVASKFASLVEVDKWTPHGTVERWLNFAHGYKDEDLGLPDFAEIDVTPFATRKIDDQWTRVPILDGSP